MIESALRHFSGGGYNCLFVRAGSSLWLPRTLLHLHRRLRALGNARNATNVCLGGTGTNILLVLLAEVRTVIFLTDARPVPPGQKMS